ncbi:alpha/beta hydrolase [Novosphingobium flavum]|uniref:Alpha/beta hydrolase n=1 Tax=Novosphingobium flavum TaxID=1778672 RepID=A0A7X1FTY5_9SPHN|nr:alpha/beta hydrolase [Novosphingobium flavum]MBC2666789.1 alpha/beta hydrolase [Novosphingobium flavum]
MTTRRWMMAGSVLFGAGTLMGHPLGALARAASAADDPLRHVHPELRGIAAEMLRTAVPAYSAETLPALRQMGKQWRQPLRPDIAVERKAARSRAGQVDVPLFVVNARPGKPRGAILHTHGGGFIAGAAEDGLRALQDFAAELDCVIVTVDYRLAPEVRWTGSIEDNYAGLAWLHANAEAIGADPARIAVMGESAGGGHAALLAITARDRGEIPLAFQCLTQPMLDDRTGSARAVPAHIGKLLWTAQSNRFGWSSFLGMAPGTSKVPAAAVPARCANLRGLPPAFIGVGGIDLFVDEDIDYARRLNDSGVAAELLVIPGAFHGFDMIGAATTPAKAFAAARLAALRAALTAA